MYGVPRASSAVCTTVAALPEIVAGGSGGGRSGGAPIPLAPPPPALLPSPNDTPSVALTPSRASGRGFQNPLGPQLRAGYPTCLPRAARNAAPTRVPLPPFPGPLTPVAELPGTS